MGICFWPECTFPNETSVGCDCASSLENDTWSKDSNQCFVAKHYIYYYMLT